MRRLASRLRRELIELRSAQVPFLLLFIGMPVVTDPDAAKCNVDNGQSAIEWRVMIKSERHNAVPQTHSALGSLQLGHWAAS